MTTIKRLKQWLGRTTPRTLKAARCRTCKATVAAGLSGDIAAIRVVVDPTPLTPTGEVHALLDGLATFTATRTIYGNAVQLNLRSAHRITSRQPHDVWPEHRCGHTHTHTHTTHTNIAPKPPTNDDPDAPPPF